MTTTYQKDKKLVNFKDDNSTYHLVHEVRKFKLTFCRSCGNSSSGSRSSGSGGGGSGLCCNS